MEKNIVLYSWNVPSGGLLQVIYEEFKYFINRNYDVRVIFYQAIVPEYYKEIFDEMHPLVLAGSMKSFKPLGFLGKKTNTIGFDAPLDAFYLPLLQTRKGERIICHELTSGLTMLPYAALNHGKVAVVIHDSPFSLNEINGPLKLIVLSKFLMKIIKMSVPFFNIVSTNNRIANVLSDNFRTGKVWVVEFGVHKCVNRPPIRERNEILAVAKWREGRKPEIYIEIAKKLGKEYKFIIAGHWDDKDYLSKIKNEIDQLNKSSTNLEIKSDLGSNELHDLYHRCKVFIRLGGNGEYGVGQGLLDAIGHGCPLIIGSKLGGLNEIKDGIHGYKVSEESVDEITSRILNIMRSDDLSEYFSKNVYELSNKYSWDEHGDKLVRTLFGDDSKLHKVPKE